MHTETLFDLTGRTALITGGSRGLGLQIAEALGEMGARVVITARKTAELEEAAEHLRKQNIEAIPLVADISKAETLTPLVESILRQWGDIDVLVNNAAATWGALAEEYPLKAWEKVINLNLTSNFLLSQAVGKLSMIPRHKGRIINIASIAGLVGNDYRVMTTVAYNASKGGIVNMTRALAAEWGRYGITVNALAPGFFHTKMTTELLEASGAIYLDRCPLGRYGNENDLKGAAVLLASDASAYMTGQIIAVDGGSTSI
jgi:gluconate 5-dehydrogenase